MVRIDLCGMCGPDLRSMHASRSAVPVLHWARRPTTAARSRRPGMPSCGLPMCRGTQCRRAACGGTWPTGTAPCARSCSSPRQ